MFRIRILIKSSKILISVCRKKNTYYFKIFYHFLNPDNLSFILSEYLNISKYSFRVLFSFKVSLVFSSEVISLSLSGRYLLIFEILSFLSFSLFRLIPKKTEAIDKSNKIATLFNSPVNQEEIIWMSLQLSHYLHTNLYPLELNRKIII